MAIHGHSLKWLLPEPASPSQGKLKSGRDEKKNPRGQVTPVLALWEHICTAELRLSGGKGVESRLTGLSGAFVVKSGKAVKLYLPLSPLVKVVQKLLGTELA